jgi:hypothetical protein
MFVQLTNRTLSLLAANFSGIHSGLRFSPGRRKCFTANVFIDDGVACVDHARPIENQPRWSSNDSNRPKDVSRNPPSNRALAIVREVKAFLHKVRDRDDLFTLEEPNGPIQEGTREESANKYSSIDRRLLRSGLKHHVRNSSSAYADFVIGG